MQNTPTTTKRKLNLNIETDNMLLYFHILTKCVKRIEQFWNKNISRLEHKFDELFTVKDQNEFKEYLSRIVAKQVLSMAEYDKIYKMTETGMITDDDKIENFIELSLYIPELFASIHSRDKKKLKELKDQVTTQLKNEIIMRDGKIEGLKYAVDERKGESENKDRIIEVQNRMIVKLRTGIDEEGGIDKLKSLIDKCYQNKAKQFEKDQAKQILERIANGLRKKDTYKTLSWAKLGKELGIHHTTAKRWGKLLGIKKYC